MRHNGQELKWGVALFEKIERAGSFTGEFDIFEQINAYWSYLPQSKQDKIFDVYVRIRAVFDGLMDVFGDEVRNTRDLTKALYPLVKELYDLHDLADMRHWYSFHANLPLPSGAGLKESFEETREQSGTRERTYLKEDYRWLVVLSVAIRAMVPVWGEFIFHTRKDTGTTFKEYYAFKLLSYANIFKSEPMERLRVYVEHTLPQDKSKESAILGAISSEDFPTWVLGLVVVRRLAVGDVRGVDPNSSLVTFIYKYIGQKVKSHDNNFIGMVKPKQVEGQAQEGENNLSKLEGYKVKQEIPAGDISMMSFDMSNHVKMATVVCPDLDLTLLHASLRSVRALETEQLQAVQITLTQWVMAEAIPPRGLLHLSKQLVIDAIAIAQACLWHRGHYELAGLISATTQVNNGEISLGGGDSRARIPLEVKAQLSTLYPHPRRQTGKQKSAQPISPGEAAVNAMAVDLGQNDWRLTLPPEWVAKLTGSKSNRRFTVPHDIKIKLANLVIARGSGKF